MIKHFYLAHRWDPNRYYLCGSGWTWELWQWRSTPHSSKLQDRRLTLRCFTVMTRILVGFLARRRDAVGVFYNCVRLCCLLLCDNTPSRSPLHQLLQIISILAGDHLVVPIGVSHVSLWPQEIQPREMGEKKQRTNEQYGLGLTQVHL